MFIEWYRQASLWFGDGLCHQLPERSFFVGDIMFPVCARCTGIYAGFTLALIALLIHYRHTRPSRGLAVVAYVIAGVAVVAMAWDGITSYSALRETSNLMRLATGVGFGVALASFVYAMLADTLFAERGEGTVLQDTPGVALLIASGVAAVAAVLLLTWIVVPVGPALDMLAVLFTFSAVGVVLASVLPRFRNTVDSMPRAVLPVAVGILLGVAGILLSKGIQAALDLLAIALV